MFDPCDHSQCESNETQCCTAIPWQRVSVQLLQLQADANTKPERNKIQGETKGERNESVIIYQSVI